MCLAGCARAATAGAGTRKDPGGSARRGQGKRIATGAKAESASVPPLQRPFGVLFFLVLFSIMWLHVHLPKWRRNWSHLRELCVDYGVR